MFWADHAPPHFHAFYGEYEALIELQNFAIIRGNLPRRAQALVVEWAEAHHGELLEDWELCRLKQPIKQIDPLR